MNLISYSFSFSELEESDHDHKFVGGTGKRFFFKLFFVHSHMTFLWISYEQSNLHNIIWVWAEIKPNFMVFPFIFYLMILSKLSVTSIDVLEKKMWFTYNLAIKLDWHYACFWRAGSKKSGIGISQVHQGPSSWNFV